MGQGFEDGAPEHGARFRLARIEARGDHARYEVEVLGPTGTARCTAALRPGQVDVGPFEGSIEPWAQEVAIGFLKVLARSYDADEGWPRELRRWRAAKG
ncbi:MAG: hypothetical protein OHK0013_33560 [Sandaracinaceae bacterium]